MSPTHATSPIDVVATVRCLQRAGRFDLALSALTGLTGYPGLVESPEHGEAGPRWAVELRAEILVDRHLWQGDPAGAAWAAIGAVEAGGAVPQVAAAQVALAARLPAGAEREALRASARSAARELDLRWLREQLAAD